MMRIWLANALLAASWLFGLSYFAPARPILWFCCLAVATVLLSAIPVRWSQRRLAIAGVALAACGAIGMPWPHAAIALLLAVGLTLGLAPLPRKWPRAWGAGAVAASGILLVQTLVLHAYAWMTARVHEVPWPLAEVWGLIPRLLGCDAAVQGSAIVLRDLESRQRIWVTWELVMDPASLLFLAGGLVCLTLLSTASPAARPRHAAWRSARRLVAVWIAWLPLRSALLIALLIHRALRADYVTAPNVADLLVNSGLQAGMLVALALLATRFVVGLSGKQRDAVAGRVERAAVVEPVRVRWLAIAAATVVLLAGTILLVASTNWDPVGRLKSGRVLVVERHSTWEPTGEPYGTTVYGEQGSYNYAAIYEYCGQFFDMSRLPQEGSIDDRTLSRCDVLIIKTPTARYSDDEVQAVVRFVRGGGSLLLVGDHTNVFNMNTYLNDVARHFGFTFRNDLLFCVSSPYTQHYRPPLLRHPVLGRVPPMNFAVSCSIDPGWSAGRMVVRNTGLWSLPPAYQESNYHPQAEYRSEMQYGSWCQTWATRPGAGRVLAFADSTLFSNFCTFQPGKAELFMGMIQWLNHRDIVPPVARRSLLAVSLLAGLVLLAVGMRLSFRWPGGWMFAAGATQAGWMLAVLAVLVAHRREMPVLTPQRPARHVVIDRQISQVPLFTGAFADADDGSGYGLLEQWIPRLGGYISRRREDDVFQGQALVVICPTRSVADGYRARLEAFVAAGGHLMVIDSPDVEGSTANGLLEPFGLASYRGGPVDEQGHLAVQRCEVQLPCQAACTIVGGEPIAWLGELPAAARTRFGRGQVTVLGFGSLFNDAQMGFHWLPEPAPDTLQRYAVLYALLQDALPPLPQHAGSSPGAARNP